MKDLWFPNLQSLGPRILFSRNSAGDHEAMRLSLAMVHLYQEGTDVTLMHSLRIAQTHWAYRDPGN